LITLKVKRKHTSDQKTKSDNTKQQSPVLTTPRNHNINENKKQLLSSKLLIKADSICKKNPLKGKKLLSPPLPKIYLTRLSQEESSKYATRSKSTFANNTPTKISPKKKKITMKHHIDYQRRR
jgi:hypothetical protein